MRMVGLIVVAFLIGGGLWLLRWSGGTAAATPDTFWYARDALRHAGYSQSAADTGAAKITCGAMSRARHSRNYNGCLNYRLQLPATAPVRFQRIFTSRPGYPLLTTPFVWAIGGAGFIVGTALLGIACGVAIVLLGLVAGLRPSQALLAEVVFYLLPTGLWASRLLAEPPMMFFLCVALIGTIILIRGGGRVAGVLTLAIGLACLCAVKPANGVALSAALAAGSVVLLPFTRTRPACLLVTGVSAAVLAGDLGVAAVLHLPGLSETLQDTYTKHFRYPDVPDPWARLSDQARLRWRRNIGPDLLDDPLIPAAYLCGVLGLFARLRRNVAWPILLAGLSGAVVASMHPLASELPRLSVVTWIPVALGIAALAPLPPLKRSTASRSGPETDSVAG